MARINRSDVIQKAVNDLGISATTDKVPNETLDKVQLVYELNKQFSDFVVTGNTSSTGTLTISLPTISSGSRIFITNLDVHYIKDATCDQATGVQGVGISPITNSVSKNVIQIASITLTAQNDHVSMTFPYPIEVKPASTVTLGGTFSLGVQVRSISVTGIITSSN